MGASGFDLGVRGAYGWSVMLSDAFIITRREIRDSIRDYRIISPILFLAVVFPFLMQLAAGLAISFGEENNAGFVPLGFIPFALLLVGFFPMAISLVIALESFVGEKERNSLEPLFASPLSDASLYIGKLIAAVVLPLCASYLGIAAYLTSLYFFRHYVVSPILLIQIILLTTVEGVVMVSSAVVVSSHATSVRAANLLATIIILPMGGLAQIESLLLIWGYADVLWYLTAALVVVAIIIVRMGIATFNREEILAREVDTIDLRRAARRFRFYLLGEQGFSLPRLYLRDLPAMIRNNRLPLGFTTLSAAGALALGAYLATVYVLPAGNFTPGQVQPGFENAVPSPGGGILPGLDTAGIFLHNVRTLLIAACLAVFTFGSGALLVLSAPLALIGYFTASAANLGVNPILFFSVFILPHGIVEIPAAVLATTFSLRLGASITAPASGERVGERFVQALAEWVKVFLFAVLPLLLLAALLEALVTPRLVMLVFGG